MRGSKSIVRKLGSENLTELVSQEEGNRNITSLQNSH
jgi:hypothetical protein